MLNIDRLCDSYGVIDTYSNIHEKEIYYVFYHLPKGPIILK